MSDPVNDSIKNMVEGAREHQGFIINASAILISVPLLALSILATQSSIPRLELGVTGLLEVISAGLFAVSLYVMLRAHYSVLMTMMYAYFKFQRMVLTPEAEKQMQKIDGMKPSEWLKEAEKGTRRFLDEFDYFQLAQRLFLGGIMFLLAALVSVAYIFIA